MMHELLTLIPEDERTRFESRLKMIASVPGAAKVYLFGSYAKGTATSDSDLDLAVFFNVDKSCFIEEYRSLVDICSDSSVDIQVQAFSVKELEEPCGIVEEILTYGVELPVDDTECA